jgi:hypothetical protein
LQLLQRRQSQLEGLLTPLLGLERANQFFAFAEDVGNSEAVAMEFYAQVTDDHFQAAITGRSILKRA